MKEVSMETDPIYIAERAEYYSSREMVTDVQDHREIAVNDAVNIYEYPSLFISKTLLELSNSHWSRSTKAKEDIQPYLRGCKWSPDGTCCLTVVNNDGIHVTELPRDLYSGNVVPSRMINILDSIIHVKEAGLVYDFCWYPGMNSAVPETCCWITTMQNGPIQMWDAFDGSLRCSYRGFNAVDEMEPALSVTFTPDASKIVAGYKKYLRTFDVVRPGREYAEQKISSSAACMATSDNLLATGSWNTTINLYSINELGAYKSIGKMHGHAGGVTHLKFAPDGLRLVSGARKDHRLLVWDIRYYRKPLNILTRTVDTNQRIYFDISPCGKYLVSGGTDGVIKVWDRDHVDWMSSIDVSDVKTDNATYKFQLHKDCCNSISIHPCRPILATGSGQYHFKNPIKTIEEQKEKGQDSKTNEDEPSSEQDIESNKPSEVLSSDACVKEVIPSDKYDDECSVDSRNDLICEEFDLDVKYSTNSENCLVFWWIGEVETS